jgi:PAS domain S-box-containing protein
LLIKLSSKSEENKEVLELLTDIKEALPFSREYMFDSVQTGIAIYESVDNGDDFVFVDFNKKAEEIEGISREKVIGKRVTKVFPGVKQFGILDTFKKVWETGKPIEHPVKIYEDDRILGWRENYVFRLNNGNVVASYFDLTKQKQAEEKVLISETNLKALINNREESIWSIDTEYNFIVFNDFFKREYEKTYKIKLEEGVNALDLLSDEKHKFWKDKYDKCLKGENFSFEFEEISNKQKVFFEASFIPIIVNDEIRGVSSVCRDITERKIVQQKIEESEKKYRAIFDNDEVNMLLIDPVTLKIVDANKGAEKFYGWTREEFLKLKISHINI